MEKIKKNVPSENKKRASSHPKKARLGRGMKALGINSLLQKKIDSSDALPDILPSTKTTEKKQETLLVQLPITHIQTNPTQPRTFFDEEKIVSLSQSIKTHGLLQPLLVSKKDSSSYVIIAGERRYKAAKKAGLKSVSAIVLSLTEEQSFETAIVENLQREDLNPIETATSFQNLLRIKNITHEQLAQTLGISRSRVTNTLRLLSLPPIIQDALISGEISSSHARTLLSITNKETQLAEFKKLLKNDVSVHKLTHIIKHKKQTLPSEKHKPFLDEYKQKLLEFFGTKVHLSGSLKKGSIKVEYYSQEDFSRILQLLGIDN